MPYSFAVQMFRTNDRIPQMVLDAIHAIDGEFYVTMIEDPPNQQPYEIEHFGAPMVRVWIEHPSHSAQYSNAYAARRQAAAEILTAYVDSLNAQDED